MKRKKLFAGRASEWIILSVLLVLIAYLPLWQNDFIKSWDDDRYILENPLIESIDLSSVAAMFTNYYDGHYHPLTLFSLALDHAIGGKTPTIYHIHNLLLHLINTVLVFFFVRFLLRKSDYFIPGIAAILFGIATMHTESVAWAAERKNLLFTAFFFSSIIMYLKYTYSGKARFYAGSAILFLLSILSKASAVTLAPTLILLDYYNGRNLFGRKEIAGKIPYFILAAGAAYVAVLAQKHTWGENLSQNYYPFVERLFYASKAFILYGIKLFLPFRLSAFYPYTGITVISGIVFIILATGVLLGAFFLIRKIPVVGFGLLFFIINISLLLKLFEVPAGDYFMADRYSYVASAGLFIAAGYGIYKLSLAGKMIRNIAVAGLFIYVFITLLQTLNRSLIWRDDESFYTDIVAKYPEEPVAYTNRGAFREKTGSLKGALNDFTAVVKNAPGDYKGYANRAAILMQLSDYEGAARDYRKAVKLKPGKDELYGSLGFALLQQGDFRGATAILDTAISLNPAVRDYYNNRGNAYYALGSYGKAISDYGLAIARDSSYANAWFNRGIAFLNLNNLSRAESDLTRVITLKPGNADAYMNRAIAFSRGGDINRAFDDYGKALSINPNYTEAYLNRGIDYFQAGRLNEALDDLNSALSLNPNLVPAYYFRGMVYIGLENRELACKDLSIASESGFYMAKEKLTNYCK